MTFVCRCCGCESCVPLGRLRVREMMFGRRTSHSYEVCPRCRCTGISCDSPCTETDEKYGESYYSVLPAPPSGRGRLQRLRDRYYLGAGGRAGHLLALFRPNPRLAVFRRFGIPPSGSLLDVGAGQGRLLASLTDGSFDSLEGCEPLLGEPLSAEGFRVVPIGVEQLSTDRRWDVILMNHSFEHMHDPPGVMSTVSSLLADHGSLVIRIPVRDGLAPSVFGRHWFQLDAPRHHNLHKRSCIDRLAEAAGLEVVASYDDSTWRQFEFSLLYLAGVSPDDSPSTKKLTLRLLLLVCHLPFGLSSAALNRIRQGDQVAFHLRHLHES